MKDCYFYQDVSDFETVNFDTSAFNQPRVSFLSLLKRKVFNIYRIREAFRKIGKLERTIFLGFSEQTSGFEDVKHLKSNTAELDSHASEIEKPEWKFC